MKLLDHNEQTLKEVEQFTQNKQNCCVVNPCGSGKTSIMAKFIEDHPNSKFVIFTKQRNAEQYYRDTNKIFENVTIHTYMKMLKNYRLGNIQTYDADYYLVDECHYIGAQEWSKAFSGLVDTFNPILIGFTATPQRFKDQGTENTIVEQFFDGNSAGNFTTIDLQKRGVFQEPEYVLSIYDLDNIINDKIDAIEDSDLSEKVKNNMIAQLTKISEKWQQESNPEKIFATYMPNYMYKEKCNRILVYVSNIKALPNRQRDINAILKKTFPNYKIKAYTYTYQHDENALYDFLKEDNNDIKVLYSIDKIMETVHIDDLNIAIMLRPSVSNRIITQQFGRVNSIGNQYRPLIIDMVDNLNNIDTVFPNRNENKMSTTKHVKASVINKKLPHIDSYRDLFATIDGQLSRFQYYTYHGFTGTLKDICFVNHKIEDIVRQNILDGDTIEDAMDKAPLKKRHLSQNILDDVREIPNPTLTDRSKKFVEENINLVPNICQKFNIQDEDIKQDLYIQYLIAVDNAYQCGKSGYQIRQFAYNTVKRHCLKMYKDKIFHDDICKEDINDVLSNEVSYIKLDDAEVNKTLLIMLESLGNKYAKILLMLYGFNDGKEHTLEEVGKEFGVTRERIRQIHAKCLRLLRAHREIRKLRPILYAMIYDHQNETPFNNISYLS